MTDCSGKDNFKILDIGLTIDQFDKVLETENILVVIEQTQSIATRPVLYEIWKVAMDQWLLLAWVSTLSQQKLEL